MKKRTSEQGFAALDAGSEAKLRPFSCCSPENKVKPSQDLVTDQITFTVGTYLHLPGYIQGSQGITAITVQVMQLVNQASLSCHCCYCGPVCTRPCSAFSGLLPSQKLQGNSWGHYTILHHCHTLQRSQFFYKSAVDKYSWKLLTNITDK